MLKILKKLKVNEKLFEVQNNQSWFSVI